MNSHCSYSFLLLPTSIQLRERTPLRDVQEFLAVAVTDSIVFNSASNRSVLPGRPWGREVHFTFAGAPDPFSSLDNTEAAFLTISAAYVVRSNSAPK